MLEKEHLILTQALKLNKDFFLYSIFKSAQPQSINQAKWEFNIYNKNTKKASCYIINENQQIVTKFIETEIINPTNIMPLNLTKINIPVEKILELANSKIKKGKITSITIMLQNPKIPVWRMIYILEPIKLITIRINALTNKIISKKESQLINSLNKL